MKTKVFIFFALVFAAVSCNYEESHPVGKTPAADQNQPVDGVVSLDQAIANAYFVYKNTEEMGQKVRRIKSVDVLTTADVGNSVVSTRSAMALSESDMPLAYVVNYENDGGYAILAANTQLPPVISLGDEGNFSTQEFMEFTWKNSMTRSSGGLDPVQEVQYALVNNSLLLPSLDLGDFDVVGVDTTMILKCLPLLDTKWGQRDPYDYYSPIDTVYDRKSAAGCVPVAGAQTLAALCYHHNWRPSVQLSEEYEIDWYALNRMIFNDTFSFSSGDYSSDAMAVASLIRAVGADISASYGYNGTSAYTSSLASTYCKLGMSSASYGNENSSTPVTRSDIFDMIVIKNYPVNARASNSVTGVDGHSFVLDGWLRLGYSILGYSKINEIAGRPDNFQHNLDLVHVNFGWDGRCDGYYLPDAFDLTEDKYREYAEENDIDANSSYVYDLNVSYLIYDF